MKNILITFVFFFIASALVNCQTPIYTAGITYTNGAPAHNPGATGSKFAIDTVGWNLYTRSVTNNWIQVGDWLQSTIGCVPPAYTPTKYQSAFVINACDSLYHYDGAVWRHLNKHASYLTHEHFRWKEAAVTIGTNPGNGYIAVNSANPVSATHVLVSVFDQDNEDVSYIIDQIMPGDVIRIQNESDGAQWIRYTVDSVPLPHGTTHFSIKVTDALTSGSEPNNNDHVILQLYLSGGGGGGIGGGGLTGRIGVWLNTTTLAYDVNFVYDTLNNEFGIRTADPQRTIDVNGEARIRDLTTDPPTRLIGADADGDLNEVASGNYGDIDIVGPNIIFNIDTSTVGPIELQSTAVVAGSYTNTSLTVDADGRITSASSGSIPPANLTFSGTASPVTLNSSTGTDVTITAGTGLSLSATAGNITITNSNPTPGILSASNGLTQTGSNVALGGSLTASTLLDYNTNDLRFFDGKTSFSTWTSADAAVQGLRFQATELVPTTNTIPTFDGITEWRVHSNTGVLQPNSLTIGGYNTNTDGMWLQSRSGENPTINYPISLQPRGGQMSVGRLGSLLAHVTFSATGLSGSTASGSVLLLEQSEGNTKASLAFGSGSNTVTAETAMFHITDAFRLTNRNGTNGTSSVRVAIGGETSDVATFEKSSATSLVQFGVGTVAPHSTIQSAGSLATNYLETVGAPTFDETKSNVIYTANTNISWTIPTAAGCGCSGRVYVLHHAGTAGVITLSQSVAKGNGLNFNTIAAGEWAVVIYGATTIRGYKLASL